MHPEENDKTKCNLHIPGKSECSERRKKVPYSAVVVCVVVDVVYGIAVI